VKRLLLLGAGGAPSLNLTRSLRKAPEPFYLIGADADRYALLRAETDERHLVPRSDEEDYLRVVRDIVRESRAELVLVQSDPEVAVISAHRDELGARTLLPRHETVTLCQDKFQSYQRWREAGLPVPRTRMLHTPDDLARAFDAFGPALWLRAIKGAAGRGSLPVDDLRRAQMWMDLQDGWGQFTAAERLTSRSTTWQSIWFEGELVVAQSRERCYWEFANRAPSGVTGITGAGMTVSDPVIDDIAVRAVMAVDSRPHGIFGVDLTYDRNGVPNPTEINIGRFFTTHLFFTEAGLNMPYIVVKLAFGEAPPALERRLNPLPPGLVWIRGMDIEPILTTVEEVERVRLRLVERRAAIGSNQASARPQQAGTMERQ